MKRDRHSVVLVSSLAQAVAAPRGHRSLGDGDNLALGAGRRSGSLHDRTNINSRGWNNSTKTSPTMKRRTQDNKENSKLPGLRKFQHVQSKLTAPVFAQRRLKHADGADKAETAPGGGHLAPFSDLHPPIPQANNLGSADGPQGPGKSVPFDHFVTKRCRGQQLLDAHRDIGFISPRPHVHIDDRAPEQKQAEVLTNLPVVSPLARASPHPSVSALYQYAQEVRTPLSSAVNASSSCKEALSVGNANMSRGSKAAAHELDQARSEDLTDSFGTWLASMSMQPEALPPVALERMHALWRKAKEAVQLQALVEQFQNIELEQNVTETFELYGTSQFPTNNCLEGGEATLQQQLLDAEEHLVCLTQLQTSPGDSQAPLGAEAPSSDDPGATYLEAEVGTVVAAASPVAQSFGQACSRVCSTGSVAISAQASDRAWECSGTPTAAQFMEGGAMGMELDIIPSNASGLKHADDGSFQDPPGPQIQPCYSSTSAALVTARTELESPYSCARFTGVAPCGPAETPGLSVISRAPEAVPFATWVAGVDGAACPVESPTVRLTPMVEDSASVATPEGTMLSPGGMPSPQAVDSGLIAPQSHQQSAGLSFVSRMPQPVAFAMWATHGKLDQTPGAASDCYGPRSDCAGSPQQSAGLSVISSIPQAMAFDVWESVQRAHLTRSAGGNMHSSPSPYTSISPLSSVGPETVSKPELAGSWHISAASTPFMGLGTNVERTSPATHVRCNPLFEIDSPASSISVLPERADALGGLAPTPSPARMVSPPSLASTPLSAFSQGLHSNLTSPVGECSPVLFNGKAFAAADLSASTVATPGACVVTVIDTSSNTNVGEPEPAAEAVFAEKLSESVDDMGSRDESPVQAEASLPGAANAADGDLSLSPSGDDVPFPEVYAMPEAAVPAAALVEGCRADYLSSKDVLSPAAENVITTKFAASPVADFHVRESSCMETHLAIQSANLAGVDTEAVDLQQVPSEEITQGVPAVVLSRVPSWDQGSPEPGVAVQEPPSGCCNTARQNGSAKVQLLGEGASQSYPNTPSAAWSPSQTTSVYATPLEAFATPTSFASLCSAICLTAMRMRGGPAMASGRGPVSGNRTPSNFTFGLSHVQPDGCGSHMDAPTPTLGPAIPVAADGVSKSNPGLPLGVGFHANAGFGSPLPLMQLSPVQMRVLDHLAGEIFAALSPANKPAVAKDQGSSPLRPKAAQEQSLTGDEGRPSSDATAVAFSLAQLLADLRSPLPAPGHQRTRLASSARETATASIVDVAPVAKIELGDFEVTSPSTTASNAQAGVSAADSVHAPSASPMPNFARLMAFLNAASHTATAPVGVGRPSGVQGQPKPALAPVDNEVDGANATAPYFNFTHLLAQLYSPLSNPDAARPEDAASGTGYIDSPITAHGGHDSPASSEAASFGFSTAAKQMASRITPSTTPGGVSFVRWAHDAGPPSFRLDNDAPRGRAARTPSTPVSFSFGAPFGQMPTNEDVTPVVGNGHPKDMHAGQGPSPTKLQLHPLPTAAGGEQVQPPCAAAQPQGGRQATNESFSFHAVAANSEVPNGNTVSSPAFSFGPQSGDLLGCAATSTAAFGLNAEQDRSPVGIGEVEAAQSAVRCSLRGVAGSLARQGSWSPAPSLGIWGSKTRGSDVSASPLNTSQTPSARGFTFNHVVASLMTTPIWPGPGTTAAELAAERRETGFVSDLSAAFQQFALAVSPTLFGMATNGDPQEAPGVDSLDLRQDNVTPSTCDGTKNAGQGAGVECLQEDVYAPAAAFLWATLLGNLQSPVPAAIHARQQNPGPKLPPTASSKGTLPANTDVTDVSEPSSTGSISGPAAVAEASAAPPPYEDLPDLIARGLCLSASTTVQPLDDGLITAEPDSCSVLGEDSTPSGCSTQVLDCLFHPAHKLIPAATPGTLDDSPVVTLQSPTGQVVIKSVSDSNRGSSDTLYAAPTAETTCTTGPAPTSPTRDPQAIDRNAAVNVDGNSSHNSPVFSFHVASEGSARSVDSAQAFLPLTVTTKSAEPCSDSIIVNDAGASTPGVWSPVVGRSEDDIAGQQGPPTGSVSPQHEQSTASIVDAMPRVLSSAGAISTTTESQQHIGAAVPSDAIELTKDNSTAGSSHIASLPLPLSVTCKRQDVHEVPVSPLTFSYLSSGTPPSTPPTAELASLGKAGSVVGQPRASPRASTGSSSHFWAPSPSGPSAASGERVTLEASNRRIRTNADLLLDFQGSPAHVAPTVPIASVTGAVTPRIKGVPFAWHGAHAPLHVSPLRKSWDAAIHSNIQPLTHVTAAMQNVSASAVFPVAPGAVFKPSSKPKDSSAAGCGISATRATVINPSDGQRFATACVAAGRNSAGMAQAGLRPRTIQPGQGPPLQQLVATGIEQALASATAAVVQHSSGLPLSHRLGLWPAAAWGIPCNPPADVATLLPSAVVSDPAKAPQGLQREGVMQAKAGVRSPTKQAAAPGRAVVTSRDVQTTPGLIKMYRDNELKETAAQPSQALVDKPVQLPCDRRTGQVPVGTGSVAINRKPVYRSRIPMPGGATRASAATKVTNQVSCASTAASSDGEESNPGMSRTPPERLVRRRRLLSCSAAAGGPQRVLVKRGTQRASVQDAADIAMGLGEEEVRRRARVLGMRISPYLRTKPSKVRPPEAPKPSKG